MLLSLLFLIILAVMASKTRRICTSGVVFGGLKATASGFYYVAESKFDYELVGLLVGTQFALNALLGIGIAYLVVKRSEDWRFIAVTTVLAIGTFLATMYEQVLVS